MPYNRICFGDRGRNQSGGLDITVVVDLVRGQILPVWETKLHPVDIGVSENTSLTKREC
jgi:hypothetical protein